MNANENNSRQGTISARAADAARLAAHRAQARRAGGAASRLLRLREMAGFSLGDRRFDIRGWAVYSHDAELVGSVEYLFIDMHDRIVRYVGIELSDAVGLGATGTILVPVGCVARPRDRRVVVLNAISAAQVGSAPRIPNRPVTRADEDATLAAFAMATSRDVGVANVYNGPSFDERRLFG